MKNRDANWWFGPNSLYGAIIGQTKYGVGGDQENGTTPADWFKDLFSGTGVTATVGVAPDTEMTALIKQYLPLVILGYFLTR